MLAAIITLTTATGPPEIGIDANGSMLIGASSLKYDNFEVVSPIITEASLATRDFISRDTANAMVAKALEQCVTAEQVKKMIATALANGDNPYGGSLTTISLPIIVYHRLSSSLLTFLLFLPISPSAIRSYI